MGRSKGSKNGCKRLTKAEIQSVVDECRKVMREWQGKEYEGTGKPPWHPIVVSNQQLTPYIVKKIEKLLTDPGKPPDGKNDVSSVATTTMGNTIIVKVRLPESRLGPNPKILTKMVSPINPNTIEGTPARFWMILRKNRVYRVSRANSLR